MSTLTWLHLSDLHFRSSAEYDIKVILEALERDLKRLADQKRLKPDLIFFSGDIVFSGEKEQYDRVGTQFFDRLLEITDLDKDLLFIVPGNHDVDRTQISPYAYRIVQDIKSDTDVKQLFDDPHALPLNMRRMNNYIEFVKQYCDLSLSYERPYYTRILEIHGWRIGVIGLNSAWTSASVEDQAGEVKDQGELLVGRHLTAAALEEIRRDSPDIVIALMHHPFSWLRDFDQAQIQDLLTQECYFILRGHLHRTETLRLVNPDTTAMVIAAGAIHQKRDYANAYNLVCLDRDREQGTVYLRRYGERDRWGADTLTYENALDGEYTFQLPARFDGKRRSSLDRWLSQRGLRTNPFALWDASLEEEADISGYFVDIGRFFDELLKTQAPCVVFAGRGCGKTAYRKMLAAQCRLIKQNGTKLPMTYTYASFERVLKAAGGDLSRIEATHYVAELLRQGLIMLDAEAKRDLRVRKALEQPDIARRLAAYQALYTPHLAPDSTTKVADLEQLSSRELLQGFVSLIQAAGISSCVVLVDELDEFPFTVDRPERQVALLAPLLGTLPLVECPGVAFKFFLPQEVEPTLRAQEWFRPGRVRIFRIQGERWDESTLQQLIGQRLTRFSAKGDQPYVRLGQLCEDNLAGIDGELARLAKGLPRAALSLANRLLWEHCDQLGLPDRIALGTWESVKAKWPALRTDFLEEKLSTAEQREPSETVQPTSRSTPLPSGWPILRLDEEKGLVWLGEREITKEFSAQEFSILRCLYQKRDSVCEKSLLEEQVWLAPPGTVSDETMAQSIARLRKKLGQSKPDEGYIETVKGRGYRLHPEGFVSA